MWESETIKSCQQIFTLVAISVVLWLSAAAAAQEPYQDLLVNGGFETDVDTVGQWPEGPGYWRGNASDIVGPVGPFSPLEGDQMLQFLYSGSAYEASGLAGCNVIQAVDLRPLHARIVGGYAVVRAGAWYDRIQWDAQTDTQFGVEVRAFSGDPNTALQQWSTSAIAGQLVTIETDGDAATWEHLETTLALPVETDFVMMHIYNSENVFNDTTGVEYDGHFADAATLQVVSSVDGDFTFDGAADADDIDVLCDHASDPSYDLDGDGDTDEDDLIYLVENLVAWHNGVNSGVGTKRGDFNLDGTVNATDLAIMKSSFGTWPRQWVHGNANCDEVVDATDLAILKANFGFAAPTAGPAPEPTALVLLLLGGLAMLKRQRK